MANGIFYRFALQVAEADYTAARRLRNEKAEKPVYDWVIREVDSYLSDAQVALEDGDPQQAIHWSRKAYFVLREAAAEQGRRFQAAMAAPSVGREP